MTRRILFSRAKNNISEKYFSEIKKILSHFHAKVTLTFTAPGSTVDVRF